MHPSFKPRGRALAPTLVVSAVLCAGLLGPSTASAVRDASYSSSRTARLEQRLARRAQRESERETRRSERETRRSEREARRAEHAQRRAAHRLARQEGRGEATGGAEQQSGETEGSGSSNSVGACQVTIAASSPRVLAGESVTLSGSVTCPGQIAAAVPRVAVYEHVSGAGLKALAPSQTLAATASGSFTTTSGALGANTVFQARLGRTVARVAVKVAPAVTLTAAPAPESGADVVATARTRRAKTSFSGTVTPAVRDALVALQVSYAATGQHWRSIAWTHTDATGAYSIDRALHNAGATDVRTIVHTHSHQTVGVSEQLSIQSAQPQRPALTIGVSADPVTAGQAVQISGVAAGTSHIPVKLLARPAGGTWAVIAESSTDEAGAYSFEESPQETTLYRVLDATASSTPLKERVGFAITPGPVPAGATAGEAVTIAGTVAPAAAGTPVVLEELGAGGIGFHPIATTAVGPAQVYSVAHTFSAVGAHTLRVRALGDETHSSTAGAPFVLIVTP